MDFESRRIHMVSGLFYDDLVEDDGHFSPSFMTTPLSRTRLRLTLARQTMLITIIDCLHIAGSDRQDIRVAVSDRQEHCRLIDQSDFDAWTLLLLSYLNQSSCHFRLIIPLENSCLCCRSHSRGYQQTHERLEGLFDQKCVDHLLNLR